MLCVLIGVRERIENRWITGRLSIGILSVFWSPAKIILHSSTNIFKERLQLLTEV
jgi:hypothetical protein